MMVDLYVGEDDVDEEVVVIEDEDVSFEGRLGCVNGLFALSREKNTFDECGARPFFAIGSMVESTTLTKIQKLIIYNNIYKNIVCWDENSVGPDRICLGMAHAFSSILVLGW